MRLNLLKLSRLEHLRILVFFQTELDNFKNCSFAPLVMIAVEYVGWRLKYICARDLYCEH